MLLSANLLFLKSAYLWFLILLIENFFQIQRSTFLTPVTPTKSVFSPNPKLDNSIGQAGNRPLWLAILINSRPIGIVYGKIQKLEFKSSYTSIIRFPSQENFRLGNTLWKEIIEMKSLKFFYFFKSTMRHFKRWKQFQKKIGHF